MVRVWLTDANAIVTHWTTCVASLGTSECGGGLTTNTLLAALSAKGAFNCPVHVVSKVVAAGSIKVAVVDPTG